MCLRITCKTVKMYKWNSISREFVYIPGLNKTNAFKHAYSVVSTRFAFSLDIISWTNLNCAAIRKLLSPVFASNEYPLFVISVPTKLFAYIYIPQLSNQTDDIHSTVKRICHRTILPSMKALYLTVSRFFSWTNRDHYHSLSPSAR